MILKGEEARRREGLCEDVGELMLCQEICNLNGTICLMFSNHMIQNVDMFCILMLFRISNETNSRLVVGVEQGRVSLRKTKLVYQTLFPKQLFCRNMSYKILHFCSQGSCARLLARKPSNWTIVNF